MCRQCRNASQKAVFDNLPSRASFFEAESGSVGMLDTMATATTEMKDNLQGNNNTWIIGSTFGKVASKW